MDARAVEGRADSSGPEGGHTRHPAGARPAGSGTPGRAVTDHGGSGPGGGAADLECDHGDVSSLKLSAAVWGAPTLLDLGVWGIRADPARGVAVRRSGPQTGGAG